MDIQTAQEKALETLVSMLSDASHGFRLEAAREILKFSISQK